VKRAAAAVLPDEANPAAVPPVDLEMGTEMGHALSATEGGAPSSASAPSGFSRELHALDELLFSTDTEAAAEEAERHSAREARYLCSPQGVCFDRQRGQEVDSVAVTEGQPPA
jgi:hypothetical protein